MVAHVTGNGAISKGVTASKEVKQDCELAPTLFSLIFSARLMYAYRNEPPATRTAYRTDGHLHKGLRMQALTRHSTTTIHDLLSIGERALSSTIEEEVQRIMGLFASVCTKIGPTINTDKAEVMHQSALSMEYSTL
ncbi:hypothetical protein SprV_0100368700 [Sparganum proliferum]